jgi:hypothetical protein
MGLAGILRLGNGRQACPCGLYAAAVSVLTVFLVVVTVGGPPGPPRPGTRGSRRRV